MSSPHQLKIVLTYGISAFRSFVLLAMSYRYLSRVPIVERGFENLNNYLMIEMPYMVKCCMGYTPRILLPEPTSTTCIQPPCKSMLEATLSMTSPSSLSTVSATSPITSNSLMDLSAMEVLLDLIFLLILFLDFNTCFRYLSKVIDYFHRLRSSSNPHESTNTTNSSGSNLHGDSSEPSPPNSLDSTNPPDFDENNLRENSPYSDISSPNNQHLETEKENIEIQQTGEDHIHFLDNVHSGSQPSSNDEANDHEQGPSTHVEDYEQPSTGNTQENTEEITHDTTENEPVETQRMNKSPEPFDASNQDQANSPVASPIPDHFSDSGASESERRSASPAYSDESYYDFLEDDLSPIPEPDITTGNLENSPMLQ